MQDSQSAPQAPPSTPEAPPDWARAAARGVPSPVLPILGSAFALATAALLAFVAVTMLSLTRLGGEGMIIAGFIFLGVATLVIVFGVLGCMLKPWAVLTNAILLSALAILVAITFATRGKLDAPSTLIGLLSAVSAVILYVGFPHARRLKQAKR